MSRQNHNVSDADINFIMKLNDKPDSKSEMFLKLCEGQPLGKAIKDTRAEQARQNNWRGITPPKFSVAQLKNGAKTHIPILIRIDKKNGEEGKDIHEIIESKLGCSNLDPIDENFSALRLSVFNQQVESMLDIARQGTAAIAKFTGLNQRRIQQRLVEVIKTINEKSFFESAENGQLSLFDNEEFIKSKFEFLLCKRLFKKVNKSKSREPKKAKKKVTNAKVNQKFNINEKDIVLKQGVLFNMDGEVDDE